MNIRLFLMDNDKPHAAKNTAEIEPDYSYRYQLILCCFYSMIESVAMGVLRSASVRLIKGHNSKIVFHYLQE